MEELKYSNFRKLSNGIQEALKIKMNSYSINDNSFTEWEKNKNLTREYFGLSEADRSIIDGINNQMVPNHKDFFYLVPTKLNIVNNSKEFDGNVAEVIAPAWWLKLRNAKNGDIVIPDDFLTRFAFGVRIPSTGIHSALVFKIVGSIDDGANNIIAPEELVALHGSDFDVDSLFALRVEILTDLSKDSILQTVVDNKGNTIVPFGLRLGYPEGVIFNSFSEMMASQGATTESLKTDEFDRQLDFYNRKLTELENDLLAETDKKLASKINEKVCCNICGAFSSKNNLARHQKTTKCTSALI